MIKIIERLRKYFFSKSKKMCLSSKVTELRNELLGNCKRAISRLEAAKSVVPEGFSILNNRVADTLSQTSVPSIATVEGEVVNNTNSETTTKGTTFKITDDELVRDYMILTHGVLIQEWVHFLYSIFAEGLIRYLQGYDLGTPKFNINCKNLKPAKDIVEIHENIVLEAKESFYGYEDLLTQSLKLFKLNNFKQTDLHEELNKHVIIRNIWQHSRGKIRQLDIEKNSNHDFEILDDNEKPKKHRVGDEATLSRPEIQRLYNTIEKCSEKFQIQAEKAKPITE
jgi:hypothetical protein